MLNTNALYTCYEITEKRFNLALAQPPYLFPVILSNKAQRRNCSNEFVFLHWLSGTAIFSCQQKQEGFPVVLSLSSPTLIIMATHFSLPLSYHRVLFLPNTKNRFILKGAKMDFTDVVQRAGREATVKAQFWEW